MMNAIVVKYLGPTNRRGSRMKATDGILTATINYDDALNASKNAENAARSLIQKRGWFPNSPRQPNLYGAFWAMGVLPNGDYVYVNHSHKPHFDEYSIDTRNWDATQR